MNIMCITKGHKGELFIMTLGFIGWGILSLLTGGILWFVYVGPYFSATFAGFYTELRDRAVASNLIEKPELE